MKNKMKRRLLKMLSLLITVIITVSVTHMTVYADPEADDPMIVVSMGDSYSSGEGIEPFYGQDNQLYNKTEMDDWLAHRSTKSWPSKLVIPGYEGESGDKTMADYKTGVDNLYYQNNNAMRAFTGNCEWFFVASSGAVTDNIKSTEQEKTVRQVGINDHKKYTKSLPVQLDVFNRINETVDFVTITIGGNDVRFSDIITTCAMQSTYLGSRDLKWKLKAVWAHFGTTREKIKQTYINIANAAPEANIIVADYPQLLDPFGKGFVISKEEAELVDSNVRKFNNELENIVEECSNEGLNIYFVDVEEKFSGHEAYSEDPWINKIIMGHQKEELDDKAVSSSYSMHPNEKGTDAYAECVNEMIRSLCDDDKKYYSSVLKEYREYEECAKEGIAKKDYSTPTKYAEERKLNGLLTEEVKWGHDICYRFIDINNDRHNELVIATDELKVLDIYTRGEEGPVHVLDYDRYQWLGYRYTASFDIDNNRILMHGSYSAFSEYVRLFNFAPGASKAEYTGRYIHDTDPNTYDWDYTYEDNNHNTRESSEEEFSQYKRLVEETYNNEKVYNKEDWSLLSESGVSGGLN